SADCRCNEFDGPPDPPDAEIPGNSQQELQNRWVQVSVFVCIEVRWRDAGVGHSLNLSAHFSLNIPRSNHATEFPGELHDRGRQSAIRAYQRWDFSKGCYRTAVHDGHVAAHTQTRSGQRNLHRLVKRRSVSHYRSAGKNAFPVSPQYSRVGIASEAKIIPVYDQSLHRISSRPGPSEGHDHLKLPTRLAFK